MIIPLLLIVLATLAAAVVAYGTHPAWGQFEHGLQFIVWSRRLEWPLVTLVIALCLLLIALVILGRRRAWWLIGLGPILALFVHHFAGFAPDRAGAMVVLENPPMVEAAGARGLADDDWVVGVSFAGGEYAFPYASLFRAPVIIQTDHDSRMLLLWSAYANRVLALQAAHAFKARDLEVVSTPANAPLIYDSRDGEFINGLTGLTLDGKVIPALGDRLLTIKTTWKQWRTAHPEGSVMAWSGDGGSQVTAPTRPILPAWKMPGANPNAPPDSVRRVTVVGYYTPAAMGCFDVAAAPNNLRADGAPVLLFRPAPNSAPRAFDAIIEPHAPGRVPSTLPDTTSSYFVPLGPSARRVMAAHPDAAFHEVVSDTLWKLDGTGVSHSKSAGQRLQPVPVDDDVDWAVLKYWYPDLKVTPPAEGN